MSGCGQVANLIDIVPAVPSRGSAALIQLHDWFEIQPAWIPAPPKKLTPRDQGVLSVANRFRFQVKQ